MQNANLKLSLLFTYLKQIQNNTIFINTPNYSHRKVSRERNILWYFSKIINEESFIIKIGYLQGLEYFHTTIINMVLA